MSRTPSSACCNTDGMGCFVVVVGFACGAFSDAEAVAVAVAVATEAGINACSGAFSCVSGIAMEIGILTPVESGFLLGTVVASRFLGAGPPVVWIVFFTGVAEQAESFSCEATSIYNQPSLRELYEKRRRVNVRVCAVWWDAVKAPDLVLIASSARTPDEK